MLNHRKWLSGVVAVGIYLLLLFIVLHYYNLHTKKAKNYVEKNSNRVTVTLVNSDKTALNRSDKVNTPKKQVTEPTKTSMPTPPIPVVVPPKTAIKQTEPKPTPKAEAKPTPKPKVEPKQETQTASLEQKKREAKERAEAVERERQRAAQIAQESKKREEEAKKAQEAKKIAEQKRLVALEVAKKKKEEEAKKRAEAKKKEQEAKKRAEAEKKEQERKRLAELEAKKKKEAEEAKKREQERQRQAQEEAKKRPSAQDLFAGVSTKEPVKNTPPKTPVKNPEPPSQVRHTASVMDRIHDTHQSGQVSDRNREQGVENAYIAKVKRQLNNWNAQSNYKGSSATITLKISSSGHFTYSIHRSDNAAMTQGLRDFLDQLNRMGLGSHTKSTPYVIDVNFRAN